MVSDAFRTHNSLFKFPIWLIEIWLIFILFFLEFIGTYACQTVSISITMYNLYGPVLCILSPGGRALFIPATAGVELHLHSMSQLPTTEDQKQAPHPRCPAVWGKVCEPFIVGTLGAKKSSLGCSFCAFSTPLLTLIITKISPRLPLRETSCMA
jgi:hypothetical protein